MPEVLWLLEHVRLRVDPLKDAAGSPFGKAAGSPFGNSLTRPLQ